jgi:MYXO-CTERM domain-containing protein
LDNEGYHLAEPTIPILEDYISEGMYFMAAKVLGDATGADGSSLPPLQVAYDSEVFTIPIKLAARNSPGQQDMLIYAITDQSSGLVGVSNYTEFEIEDQCIWGDPNTDDFQAFYEGRFNPAWEAAGQAGWTVEWAGGPWDCSPCSGYQLSTEELSSLGFVGEYEDHFLSRLHMRYTDTTASQDLMLYESGMRQAKVTSFADDNSSNRDCIAMCDGSDGSDGSDGGSDGADGGSGGSGGSGDGGSGSSGSSATPSDSEAKSGCATTGGSAGWPAALGGLGLLLALGRRRRE